MSSRAMALGERKSRSWWKALGQEKRAAIRELFAAERSKNFVAFALFGMWFGGCVLVVQFQTWPARVPAYFVIGIALHALGILMHEAVHGNLFRKHAWDRWAAFILGAPVLVSGAAYRVTHLRHHRDTRGAADPDEFASYVKNRRALSVIFYAWALLGMFIFLVHVPVNALRFGTHRERVAIVTEYALLAVLYTGIVFLAVGFDAMDVLVHGWLIPLGIVILIVNVRGWSEHLLTRPGHPLTHTRTVTSNRVVRFAMLNLNYHLEHHLFPGIPWYNLPRVHAVLRDEFHRAGASIYRSYWKFLWDAARAGIHGLALADNRPEQSARTVLHGPVLAFGLLVSASIGWNVLRGDVSWWILGVCFLGGLFLWTFLEYVLHRFVFHLEPSAAWLRERQLHLAHHQRPSEPEHWVAPLRLSLPTATAVWAALALLLGSWPHAAIVTAGVMVGYVAYELLHCEMHLGERRGRLIVALRRYHFYHHKHASRAWGVTSPLWDIVFRTRPRRASATPRSGPRGEETSNR